MPRFTSSSELAKHSSQWRYLPTFTDLSDDDSCLRTRAHQRRISQEIKADLVDATFIFAVHRQWLKPSNQTCHGSALASAVTFLRVFWATDRHFSLFPLPEGFYLVHRGFFAPQQRVDTT
jgi:hypothetical protein